MFLLIIFVFRQIVTVNKIFPLNKTEREFVELRFELNTKLLRFFNKQTRGLFFFKKWPSK